MSRLARKGLPLVFSLAGALVLGGDAAPADPHGRMMRAVFKIEGKKKEGADNEAAAAFALALPASENTTESRRLVLITAAHFFDKIKGEQIELVGRRRRGAGDYEKTRHTLPLQRGEKALWTRHPDSGIDLAAIRLDWPADCDVEPIRFDQLATTAALATGALAPGRPVFAPGYPFAIESSEAGFPILRGGHVASFPPPRPGETPTFLVDMAMFAGFSGSPVYAIGDASSSPPLILGMIFRQHELTSDFKGPFETRKVHYLLDLAVVLQAPVIRAWLHALE